MTHIQLITRGRLIALALLLAFTTVALQPAHAQTSDTWKSVAIIGGSTAAGAYIGHKIAGPTGTWVGAGVGATVGYAIDRKRRQAEYNNQYGYGYPAPQDPNSGYYGGPYDPNNGYYGGPTGGPYDPNAYPAGFQSQGNSYSTTAAQRHFARHRAR